MNQRLLKMSRLDPLMEIGNRPIMGPTPVEGFFVDVGWGTYGFKAGPVCGESMAANLASGKVPDLISAFGYDRFKNGELVGEKGAAAVGH